MGFLNKFPYTDFHELNLDWIIKHFKEFVDEIASLDEWRSTHEQEYEQLKSYYDAFISGNFTPEMIEGLNTWMQQNAVQIVTQLVKMVSIHVTDAGYMVMESPSQWNDIKFKFTGINIDTPLQPEFGHLVILY